MSCDVEITTKFNCSSIILNEAMSNKISPKNKTCLSYKGSNDNICVKKEYIVPEWQDACHKRYDMATKNVKLGYDNTFSHKNNLCSVKS